MSRREIAVNTLLGSVLLLAFAIPVILAVVVFGYAVLAIDLAIQVYLPRLAHAWADVAFCVVMSLWSFVYGIRHLQKRRWPNALSSFVIVPMIVSILFANSHSPLGHDGFLPLRQLNDFNDRTAY